MNLSTIRKQSEAPPKIPKRQTGDPTPQKVKPIILWLPTILLMVASMALSLPLKGHDWIYDPFQIYAGDHFSPLIKRGHPNAFRLAVLNPFVNNVYGMQNGKGAMFASVTVSLTPNADTYIRSQMGSQNTNYGICGDFIIGNQGMSASRALLLFDLSSLPSDAIITDASLGIKKISGSQMTASVSAYRLTTGWDEGAVCNMNGDASWNEKSNGVSWASAGGDFDPVAVGTTDIGPNDIYYYVSVTGLVSDWFDGTHTNHGFLVKVTDEGAAPNVNNTFGSRENADPGCHPVLSITYMTQIVCPDDITIDCEETPDVSVTGSPMDMFDCMLPGDVTITMDDVVLPGSCNGESIIERTFTAESPCGQSASCTQEILLFDSTPPVLSGCPTDVTILCDQALPAVPVVTATDNCDDGDIMVVFDESNNYVGCGGYTGTVTRMWTAADDCDNESTCTQVITVIDNVPPVLSGCPLDITILCDEPIPAAAVVTATDLCDVDVIPAFDEDTDFGICDANTGTITRTWTAADDCGNEATCTQVITVIDNVPPVLSGCPDDVTIECTNPLPPPAVVTATDNCDNDVVPMLSNLFNLNGCGGYTGTLTRTWMAMDDCGNGASCSQVITIIDTTDPEWTSPLPADATVECDAVPAPAVLTASDNCDMNVQVTYTQQITAGPVPFVETITRTWVASDACGNEITHTQILSVTDFVSPLITCPPSFTVLTDGTILDQDAIDYGITSDMVTGDCEVKLYGTAPLSSDNCDIVTQNWTIETPFNGVLNGTGKIDDVALCPEENIVTYVVIDGGGNMAMCSFTITVLDNEPPVITTCTSSMTHWFDADENCQAIMPDLRPQLVIQDNCLMKFPDLTIEQVPLPGTVLNGHGIPYEVDFTVYDSNGNSTTCMVTVYVMDVTPPDAQCVDDFILVLNPDGTAIIDYTMIDQGSTDNCGIVDYSIDKELFTCDDAGEIITVTLTVTDVGGNSNTCSVDVTVKDFASPVIKNCPNNIIVGNDVDECNAKVNWSPTQVMDDCAQGSEIQLFHWTTGATVYGGNDIGATIGMNLTPETDDDPVPGNGSSKEYNVGITTVHIIAIDESMNISEVCSFTITVVDTQLPILLDCPEDRTVSTEADLCEGLVPDLTPEIIANDNCPLEFTQDPAAGSPFGAAHGDNLNVTVFATDPGGNTVNCIVQLTLIDTQAPAFTLCPEDRTIEVNPGTCEGTVPDLLSELEAVDNCVIVDTIQSPAAGAIFGGSFDAIQDVTITIIDAAGLTDICIVRISLLDTIPPTFNECPDDQTVNPNVGCTYQLPDYFIGLDISDNCTAHEDLTLIQTPVAGSAFGNNLGGEQEVTLEIIDEAGLSAICTFKVTLNPTPEPTVSISDAKYCIGETIATVQAFAPNPNAVFQWFTQPGNIPVPANQISGANNQFYTPLSVVGVQHVNVRATYPGNTCLSNPVDVFTTIVDCKITIDDPCVCKNNASTLTNGQFDEVITVQAPSGQQWVLMSASGLFRTNSLPPPNAPLPFGPNTILTENVLGGGLSEYTLEGIHVDSIGYTVVLTNGTVSPTISNRCFYPNPEINNVFDNYCINHPQVMIAVSATYPPIPPSNTPFPAPQESAQLDLVNQQGQVVLSNINNLQPGNLLPGLYALRYTFNASDDNPTAAYPGCTQVLNKPVTIFPLPPSALNCNNKANVSLGPDGTATITADDILEGNYGCYDQYDVMITGKQNNIVNCWDVGKTYEVKVVDPLTGNSCWGKITIEDKLAPTINCQDVTISCNTEALSPGQIGFPDVSDNCGPDNVELTFSQIPQALSCHPLFDEIIDRVWHAKDKNNGMTSSCTQRIHFRKFNINEVVFPANRDDITLPSIPCAQADTTPANTGWPTIDGLPVGGYCEAAMNYKDKIIPVCEASYKIIRTWMIMGNCPGGAMVSHDQIIIISDKLGPNINCPAPDKIVIVNPAWNGCGARIFAPTINVTDNCTLPPHIDMQTSILAGGVLQQLPSNGGFFNVPYGNHIITYRALDLCGNMSTCQTHITIEDKAPPTAVCNDKIVVSLLEPVTHVFAKTFDDGSHDNCSPVVHFEVRRMDNLLCPGNDETEYGPTVPFFCCDILNGPVTVSLKVYVDKNLNGVHDDSEEYNECMVTVKVQDKLKPTIVCPKDITIDCLDDILPASSSTYSKSIKPNTPISAAYSFTYIDSIEIKGIPGNATIQDLNIPIHIDHEVVDNLLIKVKSPAGTEMVLFNGGTCGVSKKDINATFDDQGNPFSCKGFPTAISGIVIPQGTILSIVNGQNPNGWWRFEITDKAPLGGGLIRSLGLELTTATPLALVPEVNDNAHLCGLDVFHVDLDAKKQCANGQVIQRRWEVMDLSGNTANCIQRITLQDTTALVVNFPEDVTITDCSGQSMLDAAGEPIHNGDCELVAISMTDDYLDIVPGACFKVVRTWTIVDWCKYDHTKPTTNGGIVLDQPDHIWQDDGDGYFKYVQNIKVIDNDKPVITCPANFTVESFAANCNANPFDFTLTVTDGCTPLSKLKSNWTIDLHNNGSVDMQGTGLSINLLLPLGTHKASYTVTDGCGNFDHCTFLFTVIDAKKPTPVCITGISVDLMPSTSMVTVQAGTFESGDSHDNCTPYSGLKILIERFANMDFTNPIPDADAQPSLVFDCDDYNAGIVFIAVWVGDAGYDANGDGIIQDSERNWDYCVTYVEVQNNMGAPCGGNLNGSIYGSMKTEWDDNVEDVKVDLQGANTYAMTNHTGWYQFQTVQNGNAYTVLPDKEDAILNGVSTYDLLLIQKHLLGIKSIVSPYSLIAADVNDSKSVTIGDIIALRKSILTPGLPFPINKSWRFVDETYIFPHPQKPWSAPFPEQVVINQLQGSKDANFVAIKLGDVSGDAKTTKLQESDTREARDMMHLMADDIIFAEGDQMEVPVRLDGDVVPDGFQFTLSFDPTLDFEGVSYGNLSGENIGLYYVADGLITVSWHGKWKADLPLFTLKFRAKDKGTLSQVLSVHSTVLRAEAYTDTDTRAKFMDMQLQFRKTTPSLEDDGLALYQNIPNPFTGHTLIGFNLPQAGQAVLVFNDVSGRQVHHILGTYAAGYHQVEVRAADLPGAGMYYYTLQFNHRQLTRRMSLLR